MLPTRTGNRTARVSPRRSRWMTDFDEFFDSFLGPPLSSWSTWTPAADLYETDDDFVLEMNLPGFTHDDIELTVERGVLNVTGERGQEEAEEEYTYHLRERAVERFTRSFSLPASIDADNVGATFSDGVLKVTLPKLAEARPRRIEVAAKS